MAQEFTERAGRAVPKTAGMERVLDFEMPVRISIARTTVPLREVLRLSTGSVLELNRSLDDLVDLVVNNRVVAQGEIVVVEGNYGIRIHRVNDQARDRASQAEIRS
jgi:flagellar motor switch protein FliN/FliY